MAAAVPDVVEFGVVTGAVLATVAELAAVVMAITLMDHACTVYSVSHHILTHT